MLFQENSTSFQGNIVPYSCLMRASIIHLEEERPSPSIHEGKNSVRSCSQSVHCSSAHLHGPLGVQHRVTSPCSLCALHSKKEQSKTPKTRNISSNAIFCFHLGSGTDQLTTHRHPQLHSWYRTSVKYTLGSHLAIPCATRPALGKAKTSLLMQAACNTPQHVLGGS